MVAQGRIAATTKVDSSYSSGGIKVHYRVIMSSLTDMISAVFANLTNVYNIQTHGLTADHATLCSNRPHVALVPNVAM